MFDALKELGIGFVACPPIGSGFLTGAICSTAAFAADDYCAAQPRFVAALTVVKRGTIRRPFGPPASSLHDGLP